MDSPVSPRDPLRDAVSEAQSLAREQVAALWQIQLDRIREQLDAGWSEPLDRVFEERFSEVHDRLRRELDSAVAARTERFVEVESVRARDAAFLSITEQLNATVRRMKHAEGREAWIQAFLERATDFSSRAALFAIKGRHLRFEAGAGVEAGAADCSLDDAPAFLNAVETKDTVVTAADPSQLSPAVTALLGESEGRRAYLFPFTYRGEVVGVLYAEEGERPVNVAGLELLAALAESSLEPQTPTPAAPELVNLAPAPPKPERSAVPAEMQERHLRAERFSRTRVAQMMLFHIARVKSGREAKDLYGTLKSEIDAARDSYREQFLSGNGPFPDYLHDELVRTLAREDAAALGPSYPGPLA